MNKYFDKYIQSNIVLAKMIGQFYDDYIFIEDADRLNISYEGEDVANGYLKCISNTFLPEGYYIWNILNIKEPIITYKHLWNKMDNLRYEEYDNRDYQKIYLDNCLVIISMIKKYYKHHVIINGEIDKKIKYDKFLDVDEGKIDTCFHQFEDAGESAWQLLDLDSPIVALSTVNELESNIQKQLLEKTCEQVKKLRLDK